MKRYRRLGSIPAGSADTMPAERKLDRQIADFLAAQASRNLSPYTIRNYRGTFASLTHVCSTEGLDPAPSELTTEFFRHYLTWLLGQPLPAPDRRLSAGQTQPRPDQRAAGLGGAAERSRGHRGP